MSAAVVTAFLDRFVSSADGERLAAQATAMGAPSVLELRLTDSDEVVQVDFAGRSVAAGGPAEADAIAEISFADLNLLLLDYLGPVEISRLLEEERLRLSGPPPVLAALLVAAGEIQPHYPASLAEQGRDDLLATPRPETGAIWSSEHAPKPVFGVRRPWQAPKGTRAAAV